MSSSGTAEALHECMTTTPTTKLLILLAILACATTGCVGWTKANTALESAFVIEQVVDYRQTSEAVTYGAEANPIMGSSGQYVSPQAYFLTTTLLHIAIAAALPRGWREAWQAIPTITQGYNTYENVGALDHNRCVIGKHAAGACM